MTHFTHVSSAERLSMRSMRRQGKRLSEIAKAHNRGLSTVCKYTKGVQPITNPERKPERTPGEKLVYIRRVNQERAKATAERLGITLTEYVNRLIEQDHKLATAVYKASGSPTWTLASPNGAPVIRRAEERRGFFRRLFR